MAEPHINVTVSLLGFQEDVLGSMNLQLPTQVLLDNPGPGQLERLIEQEIMPEAVEATIGAHLQQIPQMAHELEMAKIQRAVMKLYVNDEGEAMEFEMRFQG